MTERIGEVRWVLRYLDDLDADFARFYRCDLYDLSGPRLFSRAQRVTAYGGVMAIRLHEENEAEREDLPVPAGAQTVPLESMSDLIEMG